MRVSLPISTLGRSAPLAPSAPASVRPAAQPSFKMSSDVIGVSSRELHQRRFARRDHDNRESERPDRGELANQAQIVRNRFAEAEAWVDGDSFVADSR